MKKFFSSGGGNDHQSSFVGKTFVVGRCQCVVEEVIAEGMFFSFYYFIDYLELMEMLACVKVK